MAVEQKQRQPVSYEINRMTAVARLRSHLASPVERAIHDVPGREHQNDVMDDYLQFLTSGKTAGYIDLPTGAGKTVVAAAIIRALRMRTIVVSPYGTILDQSKKTIEEINPDIQVANFDGRSKKIAGRVVNTTINSLANLAEIGPLTDQTQLIILDEIHYGALGPARHKIWRKFPNALIVGLTATPDPSRLEGLQKLGLVDPDERWTGAFTERISSMSREEAMQRGAITPADIFMVKTHIRVQNIPITRSGRYDKDIADRYLNQEMRNLITVGAIAGLDKLHSGFKIPENLRKDMESIHENVKGKRTVVFGLSIKHIEKLAERLRKLGITAEAVHGKISTEKRDDIFERHKMDPSKPGWIQVILADELLELGWDSPPTEVGFYTNLTQSGIKLAQEFGRTLRLSEETGKTRAIAVQLVDNHPDMMQRPVLLTDLFDPDYELHGNNHTSLLQHVRSRAKKAQSGEPIYTINGMEIRGIIEQAKSDAIIKMKFEGATVEGMNEIFQDVITTAQRNYDDSSVLDIYRAIADTLPRVISQDLQRTAFAAVKSDDPEQRKNGTQAFLFLNMRNILRILGSHFLAGEAQNEDVVQTALMTIFNNIDRIDPDEYITLQLHNIIHTKDFTDDVAKAEAVPRKWVNERKFGKIVRQVDNVIETVGEELEDQGIEKVADSIGWQMNYLRDTKVVVDFIKDRQEKALGVEDTPELEDSTEATVMDTLRRNAIIDIFTGDLSEFTEREAGIVARRFGFLDGKEWSFADIGKVYGITGNRVHQILQWGIRKKLKRPRNRKRLQDFLD